MFTQWACAGPLAVVEHKRQRTYTTHTHTHTVYTMSTNPTPRAPESPTGCTLRPRTCPGGGHLDAAVVVRQLGAPRLGPGLAVVGTSLAVKVLRLPVAVKAEEASVQKPRHRRLRHRATGTSAGQ
eukprot:1183568-Prorocentrum_minimum.AAC.1